MRKRATRIRVAAIIVENGKILLIAHKKKKNIYWLLPGGGVKFGESLTGALKREIQEELSVDINVSEAGLICDSVDPFGSRHVVNICFFSSYNGGKYCLGRDRRLYSFGFFTADELDDLEIHPPIKKELAQITSGKDIKEVYLGARWV